ncbi:MAG: tyrosine-type recombinase/integrase [Paracoccaceae bacterium]
MHKRPSEKNERIKRRFLEYRKYAGRLSDKTLDREMAALERFDVWNRRKDFAQFHIEQAMGFRTHLEQAKVAGNKPMAKSTMRAILATLREFILWLSQQDGFRSKIRMADADYFNLSRRDEAEARAAPPRPAPSVNQANYALSIMPSASAIDLRNKAVVALLCLTGIRVGALVSLRVKHVNLAEKSVVQNPREVATKSGKSIESFFEQGFDEAEAVLTAWLKQLNEVELYGPDDPLFPATALLTNSNTGFAANGFDRRHWKTTEPVRKIVQQAFDRAGQPNYGPHAFRHMLARRVVDMSLSVAELVATSQNLGHSGVLVTLTNYGQLSRESQRALVTGDKRQEG